MSIWHKLLARLFPRQLASDMEAESRAWMLQCPCGYEISIWELGGIRYGATSRGKRMLRRCRQCGKLRWHRVYKKDAPQGSEVVS
ncbi:MAG TPA: hypothetical protein VGX92_15760 [Pyrinomonadaceae bacterium]|nr:hypothetical protein [Pyrinomonadaceae bacterium]